MKLLLDENLPHDLRHLLGPHESFTTTYMGWGGIVNGELLKLAAEAGFDALITMDNGIAYQTNLGTLALTVVLLKAESNRLVHLRPLVPALLGAMNQLPRRVVVLISRTTA